MKQLVLALALVFATTSVYAREERACCKSVPEQLQDISVTIKCESGQGSGVVILRGDTNYVLTAGHVVARARYMEDKKVRFNDVEIVRDVIEEGRRVGTLSFAAKVISYSKADNPGEDLALLEVYKKHAFSSDTRFAPAKIIPIGTKLFHVGSLLGQFGSNSMTSGLLSSVGRVIGGTVYDQTSCTAFPGSSGGGVFTEDGRYMGMVVRGAGEGFNFIVPVRRIATWAKRVNAPWLLDPVAEVTKPTLEEGHEKAVTESIVAPSPDPDQN